MPVTVINNRCPQNHACPSVKICPSEALRQEDNAAPTVDPEKCTECGLCIGFCPMGALSLEG